MDPGFWIPSLLPPMDLEISSKLCPGHKVCPSMNLFTVSLTEYAFLITEVLLFLTNPGSPSAGENLKPVWE